MFEGKLKIKQGTITVKFKDITSIDYLLDCAKENEEPSYFFRVTVYEEQQVIARYECELPSSRDPTYFARFIAKFLANPDYRRQFLKKGKWESIMECKTPAGYRLNPICKKEIDRINQMHPKKLRFKHFVNLKTGGRDDFSRMKMVQLKQLIPPSIFELVLQEEMDESMTLSCLRWIARGLKPQRAIRKVKTDREVQNQARKAREY